MRIPLLPLACLLVAPALHAERWTEFRHGPFQVLTNAADRQGRAVLTEVEQLHHTLGGFLGRPDLPLPWPVHLVVWESGKGAPASLPKGLSLSRDGLLASWVLGTGTGIPESVREEFTRRAVAGSMGRLPRDIDDGIAALFSSLQVSGTKVTLGAAPVVELRTPGWARMHLVATDPRYSGKVRVFLSNLNSGADLDIAAKNAFEATWTDITRQAGPHLAAGTPGTVALSGKPIDPERLFLPRPADPATVALRMADLTLAAGRYADAEKLYESLRGKDLSAPGPLEGLALAKLAQGREADARPLFTAAVERNSTNARVWGEHGRLTEDPAAARAALRKAAELNPQWAEPHRWLAQRETHAVAQVPHLREAVRRNARDTEGWVELARALETAGQFADASKAWLSAERSTDEAGRETMRAARAASEVARVEQEAAERRRIADERARDLQRLKDEAMARIRAAEAKGNAAAGPAPAEVMDWADVMGGDARVEGTLLRVECVGRRARLVVASSGKTTVLSVTDPGKIVLVGAPQATLPCGVQKPPARVAVEYTKAPNARTAEAKRVEFLK